MSSCQRAKVSEHHGAYPPTPGQKETDKGEASLATARRGLSSLAPDMCSLLWGWEGQRYAGYVALLAKGAGQKMGNPCHRW